MLTTTPGETRTHILSSPPSPRLCRTRTGLKVISANLATDQAMERTAAIISYMMETVDPRVAQSMNDKNFRHALMATYPTELTTDIPEHADLDSYYDTLAEVGEALW